MIKKNILLILCCSVASFILLGLVLSVLAYSKTTPFGHFLDFISQNKADPSIVFMKEEYYELFNSALNFLLYFIISPIIILTGIMGALISKTNKMLVGLGASSPMLLVYVIPVFSLKNVSLATVCLIITAGCILVIKRSVGRVEHMKPENK